MSNGGGGNTICNAGLSTSGSEMNVSSKTIGKELRRIIDGIRRPMGWGVIHALTTLEEQEEDRRRRGSSETVDRDKEVPPPDPKD